MSLSQEATDPSSAAGAVEECDLVMKGGITSGIVYPRLVRALAERYRFRQIGGASAGAIAATMTAAAEAGRRTAPPGEGLRSFELLAEVPAELGQNLAQLFQPSDQTAAAFDVLSTLIAPRRVKFLKWPAVLWVVVRRRFATFGMTAMLVLVLAGLSGFFIAGFPDSALELVLTIGRAMLLAVPAALVTALAVAVVALTMKSVKVLNDNGFGLCDGHTRRRGVDQLPLTDWMELKLRVLAGFPESEVRPVCFGDLWDKAAVEEYREVLRRPGRGEVNLSRATLRKLRSNRATDCLVMTTDLSHRRPYHFPFDTAVFFWCPDCLKQYFPNNVITAMSNTSTEVTEEGAALHCSRHDDVQLRHLPLAPDIPLVVAARLSLSFPGLISAVPFYSVDHTRSEPNRGVVTVWFSDGGISSNFPMRFFDAAWPKRPTFGINLTAVDQDRPSQLVWRAAVGQSGVLPRHMPIAGLLGFLGAIFDTMQNWNDSTQIVMPGFRDRVVNIRQNADEGGMNLQMPAEVIEALADRGGLAAKNLLEGDKGTRTPAFDFDVHRWIRYRGAMAGLDDLVSAMRDVDAVVDEQAFIAGYAPPAGVPAYSAKDRSKDRDATAAVLALAAELDGLGHPATSGSVPRPLAEMRLAPPI
jgi:predicted acylesterase/phospholipase RssA